MSATYRNVTLAAGHTARVRAVRRASPAPGNIIVTNPRGRRWEIDLARWEASPQA